MSQQQGRLDNIADQFRLQSVETCDNLDKSITSGQRDITSGTPKALSGKGYDMFIIENPPSEVEAKKYVHTVDDIRYL